jgi:transcription initiation factor TFIIE subunit alpha
LLRTEVSIYIDCHVSSLENKRPAIGLRPAGDHWSGEATRTHGFAVEEARVDVMIGDEGIQDQTAVRKERPIWMTESTIIPKDTVMVRVEASSCDLLNVSGSRTLGSVRCHVPKDQSLCSLL